MNNNATIRARINEEIKEEASTVLASIGLTVSDAIRMLLIRVAREKALPFEVLIPNSTTVQAVKAAKVNNLVTIGGLDNLLAELNADD